MLNASCAGLRIAFFPFQQWDCGKGVFNINVPFCVTAFSMVYQLFRLACLSQLSTVEKDTDFETYQKKITMRAKQTHAVLRVQSSSRAVHFGGEA